MKILRVHCSPRERLSESYRLSESIVRRLLDRHPAARILDRALNADTISHVDGGYAAALGKLEGDGQPLAQGSMAESERLIRELEDADCLVIGTPMHNYTVPSSLKAWIDHVVRVRRTFRVTPEGKVGLLRDRPVFVAVSAGGRYCADGARPTDFLTPYLTVVLNTIGLRDVRFFSVQGAALGERELAKARSLAEQEMDGHFAVMEA